MSSSTRSRREARTVRLTAPVLVVLIVLWLAAPGAAAVPAGPPTVPLAGVTVLPVDAQVSLIVNVPDGTPPVPPDSVSVTVAGVPQPAAVVPVLSDQLAVGIVVDASRAAGAGSAEMLSGAARFVLEAPAGTHAAVVADTTPPAVLAKLQQGPEDLLRALSAVQPRGDRRTSDALTLAVRQLAATPGVPRVVILYTGGADAGGEASAALAARLARDHVLLVVVSTANDTRYWSKATGPTGGFVAPVRTSPVVPALDRVATTLRTRYLITFPTPTHLPAPASVRLNFPDVTMSADVVVPGTDTPVRAAPGHGLVSSVWMTVMLWTAVIVGALALAIWAVLQLIGTVFRRM